jgi:16S rRNA (cytosine967-C5)-methyltransferase
MPSIKNAEIETKTGVQSSHGLAESLALTAEVVGKVLGGASLNSAFGAKKPRSPSLRAAVQDLTYNTLRGWGRVDVIADKLLKNPMSDMALRGLLLAALSELIARPHTDYVVVHQAVEAASLLGKPRARGLVNALLRAYQRDSVSLNAQIEAAETGRYAHPQWWIDTLKTHYPESWRDILNAANLHPPMSLRVNRRHIDIDGYARRLEEAGIEARNLGGAAMKIAKPYPVTAIPGFSEGDVSVQDAGAQHAAILLDVRDGMTVLDACAAPGGKTGHILELADCSLTAVDVSIERTRRISENLTRLELKADVIVGDALKPQESRFGSTLFDRILLDAPCTASGVVRRHPDIRWLRRESDLRSFARTQANMLEALWPLLRGDGKLLYTTCSVFPIENAMQIREFVERHPEAQLLPLTGFPTGQILPDADTDGFYYALLHKRT